MNLRCLSCSGIWYRWMTLALLGGAIFILSLLAAVPPAGAAVTGVSVTLTNTKSVVSGDAVYAKAAVLGTGDYDHRVTWSLSPVNAGTIRPTGLFISGTAFTGTATLWATSVENPQVKSSKSVTVSAGSDPKFVDLNNQTGTEDGTALHPYSTIQAAVGNAVDGDTIKVAQGTYSENVGLAHAVLLLGGFKGGSATEYAAGHPGDFVTRNTDHLTQVTTIQSPSRANPVVEAINWDASTPITYAVDGFTLTGGFNGVYAAGRGPIDFFISQNLITENGPASPQTYDSGAGIDLEGGINTFVLNNRIASNQTDWGGGFYIDTAEKSFLIQGNVIENNVANLAGGGNLGQTNMGQGTGVFTWNIVRGNTAGDLVNNGMAGGLSVNGGPIELSHNIYANNQTKNAGAGIYVGQESTLVFRHELIYRNSNADYYSGAGVFVADSTPTVATFDHCTITGNVNTEAGSTGGLYVYQNGTVSASNCIIWGNSGYQVFCYGQGVLTISYTDTQVFTGIGNISADPRFANTSKDDYHLKSTRGRWNPATSTWVKDAVYSPCIDAGDPTAAFALEPQPNGSRTNMGAYGNTPEASLSKKDLLAPIMSNLLMGN